MTKFSDEVVPHSQQRHPNIVQLIMEVYYPPHSQLPMLIMEYPSFTFTLTQCLEKEELPLQMKYSILLDIAKGVCYLHGKRPPIVHRDLTANNVLLTSSYTAKISDLGVSRLADTFKKQQLTTAPGNSMVMPSEALEDYPVYDHKLDVFSYGCLIIHVLSGQFPKPTDQIVPEPGSRKKTFAKLWNRRFKYIQQVLNENELLPLAEQCLNNDSTGRPEIIATPFNDKEETMKELIKAIYQKLHMDEKEELIACKQQERSFQDTEKESLSQELQEATTLLQEERQLVSNFMKQEVKTDTASEKDEKIESLKNELDEAKKKEKKLQELQEKVESLQQQFIIPQSGMCVCVLVVDMMCLYCFRFDRL